MKISQSTFYTEDFWKRDLNRFSFLVFACPVLLIFVFLSHFVFLERSTVVGALTLTVIVTRSSPHDGTPDYDGFKTCLEFFRSYDLLRILLSKQRRLLYCPWCVYMCNPKQKKKKSFKF